MHTRLDEDLHPDELTLPEDVRALAAIKAVPIASEQTRALAATTLAKAAARRKEIEEQEDRATAEVRIQIKSLQAEKKAIEEPYEFQIGTLREVEEYCQRSLRQYDAKKLREAEDEQARLNAEAAKRNEKLEEKAEAKGLVPRLIAPAMAPAPAKTVRTEGDGSVTRTRVLTWTIKGLTPLDSLKSIKTYNIPASDPRLAEVPREFLVLNVPMLNKERSLGRTIPGLLCTEELDYTHRRARTS